MGTVSPRRLSFSELDVLISRPSSEKDSLLGPMVPVQIAPPILKNEGVFLDNPLLTTPTRGPLLDLRTIKD